MGGRGASSGISVDGKKYGTEYHTIRIGKKPLKVSNIKFIVSKDEKSTKTPMETMTHGRVYVLVNQDPKFYGPKSIVYFDSQLKRNKQIDLTHMHNGKQPHAHLGYWHDENGNRGLLPQEKKLVEFVQQVWNNRGS